jgi:hypothetical protein
MIWVFLFPVLLATAAVGAEEALTLPRATPYVVARRMLLTWGYAPANIPERRRKCAQGRAGICDAYLEVESCSNAPPARCVFLWTRGDASVEVQTMGAVELVLERVRCRRNCQ